MTEKELELANLRLAKLTWKRLAIARWHQIEMAKQRREPTDALVKEVNNCVYILRNLGEWSDG